MSRIPLKLLVVTHVVVKQHLGKNYTRGAFGRQIDAFGNRFEQIILLTCCEEVSAPPDDYMLVSRNLTVIALPDIWHPSRLKRIIFRIRGMVMACARLPFLVSRVDVVHPRLPSAIGLIGALFARVSRKLIFVYIAGDREALLRLKGSYMRPLAWLNQQLLNRVTHGLLCFTTGPHLAEKFGGPSKRVVPILSAALDRHQIVEPSDALQRADNPVKELLFVGGVGPAKGVDVLLRALRGLNQQGYNVGLKIVGPTPDGGIWLNGQIQALGLDSQVTYIGEISWNRVIYEYDKSDIFILPSLGEGVPHVIIEAMSRGVPVVASAVGGIPWIVKDGVNGLLVAPGSHEELIASIASLIGDSSLRKRIVLGGFDVAREALLDSTIDMMMIKFTEHYSL